MGIHREKSIEPNDNNKDYSNVVITALNAIIDLGLKIEICGTWVWVRGNTQ